MLSRIHHFHSSNATLFPNPGPTSGQRAHKRAPSSRKRDPLQSGFPIQPKIPSAFLALSRETVTLKVTITTKAVPHCLESSSRASLCVLSKNRERERKAMLVLVSLFDVSCLLSFCGLRWQRESRRGAVRAEIALSALLPRFFSFFLVEFWRLGFP